MGEFFNLQPSEKIVWEAKPQPGLKWQMFAVGILLCLVPLFILIVVPPLHPYFLVLAPLALVLVLGITYVCASMIFSKERYWVTNRRVVHKSGFIGYSVYSIPLERVSDVVISHSLWENLFGISGVYVQSLAGQYTSNGKLGSEGSLRAVPEPEKLQELIFGLVRRNRKESKLMM
ncbi:MAG: PH domain-containing protein [Candidatus Micrarchaeia archaeon]|jgi:uncharacterized membrane protein YdbT with pleckstrin-like domain